MKGVVLRGRELVGPCPDCIGRRERERVGAAEAERRRERMRDLSTRRRRAAELLSGVGVDSHSHRSATLAAFDPAPDSAALRAARAFVERFRKGERPRLFLFSQRPGEPIAPGNGKTMLACAVLRELLVAGDVEPDQAAFIRETRLTITLRRLIGEGCPEDFLDRLVGKELLVLDDVGKAKSDSAWLRELLFELVAAREDRATIVTSNYSLDQLAARDPWYRPLVSRLLGGGTAVCLKGPDRRLSP